MNKYGEFEIHEEPQFIKLRDRDDWRAKAENRIREKREAELARAYAEALETKRRKDARRTKERERMRRKRAKEKEGRQTNNADSDGKTRICDICGRQFEPKQRRQLRCSFDCRCEANRRRARERARKAASA